MHVASPGDTPDRDISWLNWTLAVDLSEDGSLALLDEEGGDAYMVGLRPTNGSPIVRLGPGTAGGLSRDGKWALVASAREQDDHLLPTGLGQPIQLPPSTCVASVRRPGSPTAGGSSMPASIRTRAANLRTAIPPGAPRPIAPEGFFTPA